MKTKILLVILLVILLSIFISCKGDIVDVTIIPENSGSVEQVDNGDGTVTLTAVSKTDYNFSYWYGGANATDESITIEIGSTEQITAVFEEDLPGWLFMMYMDGDNNLESQLWGDINEMEYGLHLLEQSGVSIGNIKILVLWDGWSDGDTALYELGPDNYEDNSIGSNTLDLTSEKWWSGDEMNVGDGNNVTEFLNWSLNKYGNLGKNMLMLSNHGGGPGKSDAPSRAVCWDDTDGHDFLTTLELNDAIEDAGFGQNNKLDIIGFDVCMLGNIEEAYEHANIAKYFIASPESEQGDGWEFNDWIPRMTSDSMDAEILVEEIVKSYKDNFGSSGWSYDQTLSGASLIYMEALKTAISDLASTIISEGDQSAAKSIMNGVHGYTYDYLKEFGEFCKDLENSSTVGSAVQTAAANAGDALGDVIVYAWADSDGGDYDGAGSTIKQGLSICDSPTVDEDEIQYSDLSFTNGNDWLTLVGSW